jgi:hypothetical protein
MCSESTTPGDSAGAQSQTQRKEGDEGLLDKAKEKLTGSDEEETPEERSAQQQHRSEEAPPPGEEPTSTGHDSPKTGPA